MVVPLVAGAIALAGCGAGAESADVPWTEQTGVPAPLVGEMLRRGQVEPDSQFAREYQLAQFTGWQNIDVRPAFAKRWPVLAVVGQRRLSDREPLVVRASADGGLVRHVRGDGPGDGALAPLVSVAVTYDAAVRCSGEPRSVARVVTGRDGRAAGAGWRAVVLWGEDPPPTPVVLRDIGGRSFRVC